MSGTRILIDTNVLIALEDPGRTDPIAADFSRRCQGSIALFIHSATRRDLRRDRDDARRVISTSRIDKYPVLDEIPLPDRSELTSRFGPVRNDNDAVDVALLHALSLDVVDLIITQDGGIHKRVRGGSLEERVLTLADAVAWLRALQDPVDDGLRQVEDIPAYSIDLKDPIFASLREDYDFDRWWRERCVADHRRCWIARGAESLDGIVVRKEEGGGAIGRPSETRVLKLCTFKVASGARGHKVGELLLRKALWHAQLNGFQATYLTAFSKQTMLVDLLERYGFQRWGEAASSESIYVKPLSRERLTMPDGVDAAAFARANYPRFALEGPVDAYAVPIRWSFHRRLFPEAARLTALPLFGDTTFDERYGRRTAGNTIRKVYVCQSRNRSMKGGDVVLFYQSKDAGAHNSQALTTVGVVEQVRRTGSSSELIRFTAGRSVFSKADLENLSKQAKYGVMVIDFLLIGHLDPPLGLTEAIQKRILTSHPQTVTRVPLQAMSAMKPSMNFGFEL